MSTETISRSQERKVEQRIVSVGTKGQLNCESHSFSDNPPFIIFNISGYVSPHQKDPKSQTSLEVASSHGASVVFFNYQGQEPGVDPSYRSFQSYWKDTRAAFHEIEADRPAIIVAHSMGANFALQLMNEKNVAGAVLIAPVVGFMDGPIKRGGKLVRESGLGWNRFAEKITQQAVRTNEIFPFMGPLQYTATYLMGYRRRGGLKHIPSSITKPVVVLASQRDSFVRPTHINVIVEKTNADVRWVQGAKHPMIEPASLEVLGDVLQEAMVPAAMQHRIVAATGVHP